MYQGDPQVQNQIPVQSQSQNLTAVTTPAISFDQNTTAPDSPFQSFLSTFNGDSPSNFIGPGLGNESKFYIPSPASFNIPSPSNDSNKQGNVVLSDNQLLPSVAAGSPSVTSIATYRKWTTSGSATPIPQNAINNQKMYRPKVDASNNQSGNADSIYKGAPVAGSTVSNIITNPSFDHQTQRKIEQMDEEIRQHLNSARYLVFLAPHKETVLYDLRGNRTEIDLTVTLSGNFFLSERHPSSLANEPESTGNPPSTIKTEPTLNPSTNPTDIKNSPELASSNASPNSEKKDLMKYDLTFYRRNLFHVSATVSNAHNAVYAGNSENPLLRSRILSLSLAVTVIDDKTPKKLLYCPPKSDFNPNDRKVENQDPAVKLIYPKSSGYDEVVNWKRLQFRTATAHNGRKKLQNYFSVCVSVFAELENAQRVCLVKSYSRPIVVRGRNPRFYQNRDNIIIPEGAIGRGGLVGSDRKLLNSATKSEEIEEKSMPNPARPVSLQPPSSDNGSAGSQGPTQVKQEPRSASDVSNPRHSTSGALSLVDDDGHSDNGPGYVLKIPTGDDSVSPKNKSSQQGRDIDYEYFPMPLNYWLPPVEVVYRPHAVHHPLKLPTYNAQGKQNQQQRQQQQQQQQSQQQQQQPQSLSQPSQLQKPQMQTQLMQQQQPVPQAKLNPERGSKRFFSALD